MRSPMPQPDRRNALDHIVVLMFENRSFDNILGRLYQPGEVRSFDGVLGKDLTNPIPDWAQDGSGRTPVPYGVAANMNTPSPAPCEEYPHITTQLFCIIDPSSNRGAHSAQTPAPSIAPSCVPPARTYTSCSHIRICR